MKIPEPMMPLTAIIVASSGQSLRTRDHRELTPARAAAGDPERTAAAKPKLDRLSAPI